VQADAYTDGLTGLPTRKVFVEELRRRLSESKRYDSDTALMLIQVDELTADATDRTLRRQVNTLVGEHVRHIMRDADLVARFDEDQFAVLLPRTSLADSFVPAERLRRRVSQWRNLHWKGSEVLVTVSIGLASSRSDDTAASIVQRAQEALWHAVREGGNRAYQHGGTTAEPASDPDPSLLEGDGELAPA
jgi:diguanylate cyclase